MSQTVADFMIQRLHEWGIRRLFGYPGDGINGILGALERAEGTDHGMQFVQSRHEELSAFMACAHAKYTGAVRAADERTMVIADGFSCHEMLTQNGLRRPLHTAEVARMALERSGRIGPREPSSTGWAGALREAALIGGALGLGWLAARAGRRLLSA